MTTKPKLPVRKLQASTDSSPSRFRPTSFEPGSPSTDETTFVHEPVDGESVKFISREIYSKNDCDETDSPRESLVGTPSLIRSPRSQGTGPESQTDVGRTSQTTWPRQENYWGTVEPFPLELHEIVSPPISPPKYLTTDSSLPPLPEDSTVESTSESLIRLECSDGPVLDGSWSKDFDFSKETGEWTTYTIASGTSSDTSPGTIDWEQFVFVEHLEDKLQQHELFTTPTSSQPDVSMMREDDPDERLQKRLKNWPRYLQNLLEA